MLFPGGGSPKAHLQPLDELVADILGPRNVTISGISAAPNLHKRPAPAAEEKSSNRYCKIIQFEFSCIKLITLSSAVLYKNNDGMQFETVPLETNYNFTIPLV